MMHYQFDYFDVLLRVIAQSDADVARLAHVRDLITTKTQPLFRGLSTKDYDQQLALKRCELRPPEAFARLRAFEANKLDRAETHAVLVAFAIAVVIKYRKDRIIEPELIQHLETF